MSESGNKQDSKETLEELEERFKNWEADESSFKSPSPSAKTSISPVAKPVPPPPMPPPMPPSTPSSVSSSHNSSSVPEFVPFISQLPDFEPEDLFPTINPSSQDEISHSQFSQSSQIKRKCRIEGAKLTKELEEVQLSISRGKTISFYDKKLWEVRHRNFPDQALQMNKKLKNTKSRAIAHLIVELTSPRICFLEQEHSIGVFNGMIF